LRLATPESVPDDSVKLPTGAPAASRMLPCTGPSAEPLPKDASTGPRRVIVMRLMSARHLALRIASDEQLAGH
jgi:hypothetical protein